MKNPLKLSDKTYDILKNIAMYILPGLGTLYFSVGQIWGLPYVEQIIGTITAIDTFLAFILGLSKTNYEGDGVLNIDMSDPNKDTYMFEVHTPLDTIAEKDTITLKINAYGSGENG